MRYLAAASMRKPGLRAERSAWALARFLHRNQLPGEKEKNALAGSQLRLLIAKRVAASVLLCFGKAFFSFSPAFGTHGAKKRAKAHAPRSISRPTTGLLHSLRHLRLPRRMAPRPRPREDPFVGMKTVGGVDPTAPPKRFQGGGAPARRAAGRVSGRRPDTAVRGRRYIARRAKALPTARGWPSRLSRPPGGRSRRGERSGRRMFPPGESTRRPSADRRRSQSRRRASATSCPATGGTTPLAARPSTENRPLRSNSPRWGKVRCPPALRSRTPPDTRALPWSLAGTLAPSRVAPLAPWANVAAKTGSFGSGKAAASTGFDAGPSTPRRLTARTT